MSTPYAPIKDFMLHHYRHFNSRTVVDASEGWVEQLEQGNKMFLAMAGAMSTAELGLSLAELIRQEKIHGICCTGANLEEDLFNLVAHPKYKRIADWRNLTPEQEMDLAAKGWNRVTDTCIPEKEAMRLIEKMLIPRWQAAGQTGESYFPHEFLYKLILEGDLDEHHTIDPKDSWLIAAAERNLPLFVPGWEDSTLGNLFVACAQVDRVKNLDTVKSGLHYMRSLIEWYTSTTDAGSEIGFFQIGGGIAGDFPICVVPLLRQDLRRKNPMWSYFCQISDSTASYGSYSGAVPNEKITWGKLDTKSPKFIIESDATIVAPLVFAFVLAT